MMNFFFYKIKNIKQCNNNLLSFVLFNFEFLNNLEFFSFFSNNDTFFF